MSWYALSNLVDGRGMSWRVIGAQADATEDETVVPAEYLAGLTNPVWDAERHRPVSLKEWYASRDNVPQGSGSPIFATNILEGTFRESPNFIGSFGTRLTRDLPVPSDEWTQIPFNEVLWDTGGMFDTQHGAFVALRAMACDFSAGGQIVIRLPVGMVCLDLAIYKNGSPEFVCKGGPSGYTQETFHAPMSLGRSIHTANALSATAGDVFEVYVRHDVGDEVPLSLSGRDLMLSDDLRFFRPTANYFMGTYAAI